MEFNLKQTQSFLNNLKKNNNREWFKDNKSQYEEAKNYFLALVESVLKELRKFDSSISDEIKAKDTIFRIYRDVRFSKDKEPYKTNFGASISPGGKKSPNAGYYIHLEPGNSFIGGGIYMPPSAILKYIRMAIYNKPEEFLKIINKHNFKKTFGDFEGEKLKSYPRGFDKNFEYINLLKYKSYAVIHSVDDEFWLNDDPVSDILTIFKTMFPLVKYLNKVVSTDVLKKRNAKSNQKIEEDFIMDNFDI